MAHRASDVQAKPLIHPSSSASPSLNPFLVEADNRGNMLIIGLWVIGQDAIIDVRVTDTNQPSVAMQDPEKVLKSQEKEKERKYLKTCQQ